MMSVFVRSVASRGQTEYLGPLIVAMMQSYQRFMTS